jgi:transposase
MLAPYSYDLRTKAIEAVKRGQRKIEICRMLQISRNTLDLWLKKERETGDYQANTSAQKGRAPKITDSSKFQEFVKEHKGETQTRIAQLWGENVTQQNVSYACKKLGITRKKKLTDIKKETKKKEANSEKN